LILLVSKKEIYVSKDVAIHLTNNIFFLFQVIENHSSLIHK